MFLMDTSVILSYLFNPKRLGPKTQAIIRDRTKLQLSSISIAEVFVKQLLGKLKLRAPMAELVSQFGLTPIGFNLEMATELATLGTMVGLDPFDRMITASAKSLGANLITSDRQLLSLGFDWILDSFK
jgi:PIN domain nuclease of toxin-antitoxin system